MNHRKIVFFIFLIIILNSVFSATISGTVFEWYSFEKLSNVVVEINTVPLQRNVTIHGAYSFEVPIGEYVITAEYYENGSLVYYEEQEVSVLDEGNFVVDLLMFPVFENISDELDAIDFDEIDNTISEETLSENNDVLIENNYFVLIFGIILIILIVGISYFFYNKNLNNKSVFENTKNSEDRKNSEEHLDDYAEEVLALLRRRGNRLTQKEIRDEIKDIGEAKISLIITELESIGKVKKIKKGRGNIIILKEK